jgi:PKD repeat protein
MQKLKLLFALSVLIVLFTGCTRQEAEELTFNPTSPTVGQSVRFTVPYAGNDSEYHWDFGDGAQSTTQSNSASHSFSQPITYNISVNVTQNGAGVAVYSTSIVVN